MLPVDERVWIEAGETHSFLSSRSSSLNTGLVCVFVAASLVTLPPGTPASLQLDEKSAGIFVPTDVVKLAPKAEVVSEKKASSDKGDAVALRSQEQSLMTLLSEHSTSACKSSASGLVVRLRLLPFFCSLTSMVGLLNERTGLDVADFTDRTGFRYRRPDSHTTAALRLYFGVAVRLTESRIVLAEAEDKQGAPLRQFSIVFFAVMGSPDGFVQVRIGSSTGSTASPACATYW